MTDAQTGSTDTPEPEVAVLGRLMPLKEGDAFLVADPLGDMSGGADGFFARAEVEGSDAFYFAAGHNERSEPYELLNLKAGWRGEAWTLTFWGRNVLDKTYAVQGYAFGLEPPDYAEKLYLTYGDPAQFGVTLDLAF